MCAPWAHERLEVPQVSAPIARALRSQPVVGARGSGESSPGCTQHFEQQLFVELLTALLGTSEPAGGNTAEGRTEAWFLKAHVWILAPLVLTCHVHQGFLLPVVGRNLAPALCTPSDLPFA